MKKLTRAAQQKAAAFLKSEARPLEQKLYTYHFKNGSQTDVLTELAHFQNPDGGFGHALEPDLRLSGSSVIATTIAFQRLREIHVPADQPLVVNGCRYLLDSYDSASVNWPIIPPNVDEAPHAPWWVYGDDLSKSLSNPRAEILGYLYEYADCFTDAMRQQVTESVVDYVLSQPDNMEMHDFLCYLRLYETSALPQAIKTRLFKKLQCIAEKIVTGDPAGWAQYGLQPLAVVSSPESPFAPLFRSDLDTNLDFVIDQLAEDGSWRPNWTWAESWPDAWAQAERDWRGVLTLDKLRTLRDFGRLE